MKNWPPNRPMTMPKAEHRHVQSGVANVKPPRHSAPTMTSMDRNSLAFFGSRMPPRKVPTKAAMPYMEIHMT